MPVIVGGLYIIDHEDNITRIKEEQFLKKMELIWTKNLLQFINRFKFFQILLQNPFTIPHSQYIFVLFNILFYTVCLIVFYVF